jgi:hypothetical protein
MQVRSETPNLNEWQQLKSALMQSFAVTKADVGALARRKSQS